MAETPSAPTPTTSQQATTPSETPIIKAGQGGVVSRRALEEASGIANFVDEDPDNEFGGDDDEDEVTDEAEEALDEVLGEERAAKEGEEDEKKEEEEDPSIEPVENADIKVSGRAILLKLDDGRQVKLPPDATILHKVDGELREISLNDAINREVGELTVEQRLSHIANVKNHYEQTIKKQEARWESRQARDAEIAKLAVSDTPDEALAMIAEEQGILPGEVMRNLFKLSQKWVAKFQEIQKKGGGMADLEAYFASLDTKALKRKLENKTKEEERTRSTVAFQHKVNAALKQHGFSEEEFVSASEELLEKNAYEGVDTDEKSIEITLNHLRGKKHEAVVDGILKKLKASGHEQLRKALLGLKNVAEYSAEELEKLAREALRPPAKATKADAKPALNGHAPAQNNGAKAKEKIVKVRDLRRF